MSRSVPHRSNAATTSSAHGQSQSSSVPSTPHQHARQFSFESREPSPSAGNNHSPRSAYSETNSTLPSLRPLPPRLGGCKYETAQINSRRRIPYSVGNDRLEKLDLRSVKSKLSEDEDRRLAADIRILYDRLLPTNEVEEKRKKLVQKLEKLFNDEWPGHDIRVNLFGSSGNLLCSDDSDSFGGTLSSYTWICLIIAFLQLRTPPVLPALHQMPYKTHKSDGTVSDFADNLKKIKGFGNKNKSSVAELLFQFFRFYAHEFDYDKHVLSIRQGRLVTKQDKKWNYAVNNQLCVEEPFNTSRNLGNTADEYSFRGVHLELRRAFDLLSEAKLEEACEQYVFPKEEERVWTRPPPQPRPVLVRSSSQTHSGRGGRGHHRGGRHNNNNNNNNNSNNFHRNGGGSNRRASSSVPAYDANMFVTPITLQQDMSWFQNPHYQFQYAQQDLMTQMAYHQESMRQFQLYTQSPAFLQQQTMNQAQRLSATNSGSGGQQSSDRSRTNSFDNVPVSAPLRPDLYALYGMNLGHTFFPQTSYGTYPTTTTTTTAASATTNSGGQDFRRSLQRSTLSGEGGLSASSSSIRSQSQPAQRSPSANPGVAYHTLGSQTPTSAVMASSRNANGVPIPSFMSDEADFDETPRAVSDSPETFDVQSGFFQSRSLSPTRLSQLQLQQQQQQQTQQQHLNQQQHLPNGIAFGDLAAHSSSPERRRLSTEQLPQTLLDRRMRRASRSPSPLGHARAFSVGGGAASAPLASAPFPGSQSSQSSKTQTRPLVVNGSGLKMAVSPPNQRQCNRPETLVLEDSLAANMDNALHINVPVPMWPVQPPINATMQAPSTSSSSTAPQLPLDRPPIVVNGSNAPLTISQSTEDASFRERIAMMNSIYLTNQLNQQELQNGNTSRLAPSARQRLFGRQPQSGVIAPLDLAIADNRVGSTRPSGIDSANLSPVYENRTPSPSAVRKQATAAPTWLPSKTQAKAEGKSKVGSAATDVPKETHQEGDWMPSPVDAEKMSVVQKPGTAAINKPVMQARENGHVRGAKSEGDGGWQKAAGKGKKKTNAAPAATTQPSHAELPPRNESDRKGG
ncbi:hypothetical protein UVI_02059110 [Ustilaginoidea virens]|uniref:polynucleotide adenylyltransferase n=1 Tax=Ustilaginoidea virens TaxID=1159556 RepID=A0A1B5L7T6_USTVR|nr:hypothetical protein UVI_02059110 [Ustilaginoidea virens]